MERYREPLKILAVIVVSFFSGVWTGLLSSLLQDFGLQPKYGFPGVIGFPVYEELLKWLVVYFFIRFIVKYEDWRDALGLTFGIGFGFRFWESWRIYGYSLWTYMIPSLFHSSWVLVSTYGYYKSGKRMGRYFIIALLNAMIFHLLWNFLFDPDDWRITVQFFQSFL